MRRPSICSVTPWLIIGGLLLAACGDPDVDIDDNGLQASPTEISGSEDPTDGATDAPTDPATDAPDPSPTALDPAVVCDGREDEAFIEVLSPLDGATVSAPIAVEGCGNTFEAAWLWRVTLADGTVAGQGHGMMTCGTGCVGTFSELLEVTGTGPATLRVFEESAMDGSEVNVVEVAIIIG